jgi:hypothetical protein
MSLAELEEPLDELPADRLAVVYCHGASCISVDDRLAYLSATGRAVLRPGDGVQCARRGQQTPQVYYSVERMVKSLASRVDFAT